MKRKILGIVIAIMLVAVGLVAVFSLDLSENVTTFSFEEEVNIVDGKADIKEHSIPFTLEEEGTYVVNVKWSAEKSGMLSGVALRDEADEILFFCTGESVDAASTELELESGEYCAQYMYFTNEEELEALLIQTDTVIYGNEVYEYAENENYYMTYYFNINRVRSTEYNVGLLLGMLTGAVAGILIVTLSFKFTKIKKDSGFEYDERQLLARGEGFKYAYMTAIIYNAILCIFTIADVPIPVEQSVMIMAGILISIMVCAVYCIKREAYVSLNENTNRLLLVFVVLGGINFSIGILHCIHGTMVENGIVTHHALNLLCGIFLLTIAGVLFVHTKFNSSDED